MDEFTEFTEGKGFMRKFMESRVQKHAIFNLYHPVCLDWYKVNRVRLGCLEKPYLQDELFSALDAGRCVYHKKYIVCSRVKRGFRFVPEKNGFASVAFTDFFEELHPYKGKDIKLLIHRIYISVDALSTLLSAPVSGGGGGGRGRGRGRDRGGKTPLVALTIKPLKILDKDYWNAVCTSMDGVVVPLALHGFAGDDKQCPINLKLHDDYCHRALALLDGGVFDSGHHLDVHTSASAPSLGFGPGGGPGGGKTRSAAVGYSDKDGRITFTDASFAPAVFLWGERAGKEHTFEEVALGARHIDDVRQTYFPSLDTLSLRLFNNSSLSLERLQEAFEASYVYLGGILVTK